MFKVHRISSVDWRPAPVVALATSADSSRVAAARADGSLEIWIVSPGSLGWHCLLTIHGDPSSSVSSLVWLQSGPKGRSLGRLLSSSIDGTIYEWDFFDLRQKKVLDSIGISIWQMAAEPSNNLMTKTKQAMELLENGHGSPSINSSIEDENSDSECENGVNDIVEPQGNNNAKNTRIAIACDDGCVRIYHTSDADILSYSRTLPRVSGRTLSVAWSSDACRIYSGSSDGFIRCWDAKLGHEIYRVTAVSGSLGTRSDICIWSLLVLRCGTIVAGDSSGSVQFWDGQFGTLLQAHSYHKGDVNALAVASSHDRVFSAGSDGQVILYRRSSDPIGYRNGEFVPEEVKQWVYIGYVRAHTHDVKALTIAVSICDKDRPLDGKVKRLRSREKPVEYGYHKWAALGAPMLISAGDDAKLFAYSVKEFTKFSPHDICPAPQRTPMQLVPKTAFVDAPMLLIQGTRWVDIYYVRLKNSAYDTSSGFATRELVAQVKCKDSQKIVCSTISSSGTLFAYSDLMKPKLFELEKSKFGKSSWSVNKRRLPRELPIAHCMLFSSDSSRLLLAGQDRRIYVVDAVSGEVIHAFTPRVDGCEMLPPCEQPITKMFASNDGKWLAAVNSFGDIYIFNLETLRQHLFLSRLNGASVTSGGFAPRNSNFLIVSTTSNQVYELDVGVSQSEKCLIKNIFSLPQKYQEFPGEVIGLSFQPSSNSSSAIIYSPRAMYMIDTGMLVDRDDKGELTIAQSSKLHSNGVLNKRKLHQSETKYMGQTNFCSFRDPVLFVEHLSENSLLVVDKPWIHVVEAFDAQPVHRHIFGT